MDLNFGINTTFKTEAVSPILVSSGTVIAIVVTADLEDGFYKFNNAEDGLKFVKTNNLQLGTLRTTLKGIFLQAVNCPVVAYVVRLKSDIEENTLNVSLGIEKLTQAYNVLELNPDLIIASGYSGDVGIGAKIDAIATKLGAIGIVCDFGNTEAQSSSFLQNFGSRNLLITNGISIVDNEEISNDVMMAGLIAYWDNGGDNGFDGYGWSKSHSNRVVKGIEKSCRKDGTFVEFVDSGDCEARRLRQKGMNHILRDEGWRSYGFETTSIEPLWQPLDRVRTFLKLARTLKKSLKYIRDRDLDELIWAKKSIEEFFRELKGNNVVIGFEAFFDTQKNTKATVLAGKFYLKLKVQDSSAVRELNIEIVLVDEYGESQIAILNS